MRSISSCIQKIAIDHPSRTAIVASDREINYAELYKSIQLVHCALKTIGSTEQCVVAVIAYKELNTVQLILGALQAGVVVVPINPLLKPSQLQHILSDSNASILVCKRSTVNSLREKGHLPQLVKKIVVTDDSVINDVQPSYDRDKYHAQSRSTEQQLTTECNWNDFLNTSTINTDKTSEYSEPTTESTDIPAVLLYTSGSTGRPKGVIFTQRNLYFGAASISEYLKNNHADRILALMPFSFDYGLSQLTSAMYTGATLVLFDYFVPKGVIEAVVRYKITGIPAVPHVWNRLALLKWPVVEHLRYVTSTGGRLEQNTITKLEQLLPTTSIYSMYGFTEAFRATYLPPEQLSRRPRSIGRAVPHAHVLIVDSTGNELPAGEVGELIQSGPLVSAGYWQDAHATKIKFRPRSLSTGADQTLFAWSGDLVYSDEDGYLYFVSRMDDQIKLNGYRLTCSEIELAISDCQFIQEIRVICIQRGGSENSAIAFVSLRAEGDKGKLLSWCKKELPGYMVPSDFIVLDILPVTPNSKIDKTALLHIYESKFSEPTSKK